MKNKLIKFFALTLCVVLSAAFLTACSTYEVSVAIGDGMVENDDVTCAFKLDDMLTDGYELKGTFSHESEANLDGEFVLSISFCERFAENFTETVLYSFKGNDLKNADGGKINFTVKFDDLKGIFPETSENKSLNINFHRSDKRPIDVADWNSSSFNYVFDGKTVKVSQ